MVCNECECQCCITSNRSTTIIHRNVVYYVCSGCAVDLFNLNLSKVQFFLLLENGHTTDEFLLHCDFYDERTGEALQPCEIK